MDFEADTNQTLHSYVNQQQRPANNNPENDNNKSTRSKLTIKDKSFAKTITEELDSELENMKPFLMPVSELEEDKYDLEKADKKQREVVYMTDFLDKDITYTLNDTVRAQETGNRKAIGATKEVSEHAKILDKKLDGMMANIIKMTNFNELQQDSTYKSTADTDLDEL